MLLIALATLGTILLGLLLVCVVLTCCGRTSKASSVTTGLSFFPQKVSTRHSRRQTIDRRAMIQDTSSESGQSDAVPYVPKVLEMQCCARRVPPSVVVPQKPKKQLKGALKKPKPPPSDVESPSNTLPYHDQKDRSLTVMIPRAKYHPAPPTSPHANLTTFDKRKASVASSNEAKLLSYLDAGPAPPNKAEQRKYSNSKSDSFVEETPLSRKTSGG